MKFGKPMIWREPLCHVTDCYFCLSKKSGFGKTMRWIYPKKSAHGFTLPVLHSDGIPYPTYQKKEDEKPYFSLSSQETATSQDSGPDNEFEREGKPKLLTQAELNDLVRDLELTKEKAQLLASRMKERHFLTKDVSSSYYRDRHKPYVKYYTMEDNICFCHDISGLFNELGQLYDAKEWRLFIDGSKDSLKAVLLHNGNHKPSIPIAHAVNMKESHETMAKLLNYIKYDEHDWKVCCDLKIIAMLCGLQGGYTKYCCFLCLWDSRARDEHYIKKDWPKRENITVGRHNVKYVALVKMQNIILPPLHIKLGLVKNFIKRLDKEGQAFAYLKTIFPNLTLGKIKEGMFDGPQIRKLLRNETFETLLSSDENLAWNSFRLTVSDFLGNNRNPEYVKIIGDLLTNYEKIGMQYPNFISI